MEAGSDPALHGTFGFIEDRGHLAVAVAREVGELDRLSLDGGDVVESLSEMAWQSRLSSSSGLVV